MRARRSGSRGFTLVEIAIVISIIAVLAAAIVPAVFDQLRDGKVESSIAQAQNVLQSCEMARRRVISSTRSANNVVTNTYNTMATWSGTGVLEGQLANGVPIPRTNPFGNPILVQYDSRRCYVAVDLDFLSNGIGSYETVTVNGNTRVIVSTRPTVGAGVGWVVRQKRALNGESTR